jgi:hypothetical protein
MMFRGTKPRSPRGASRVNVETIGGGSSRQLLPRSRPGDQNGWSAPNSYVPPARGEVSRQLGKERLKELQTKRFYTGRLRFAECSRMPFRRRRAQMGLDFRIDSRQSVLLMVEESTGLHLLPSMRRRAHAVTLTRTQVCEFSESADIGVDPIRDEAVASPAEPATRFRHYTTGRPGLGSAAAAVHVTQYLSSTVRCFSPLPGSAPHRPAPTQ